MDGDFLSERYGDRSIHKKTYYSITCDGKICDMFLPVDYAEKRFYYLETEDDAKLILEKLEHLAKSKGYSDKKPGEFWFITKDGVHNTLFCDWDVNGMKRIGNCFDTREDAKLVRKILPEIFAAIQEGE